MVFRVVYELIHYKRWYTHYYLFKESLKFKEIKYCDLQNGKT